MKSASFGGPASIPKCRFLSSFRYSTFSLFRPSQERSPVQMLPCAPQESVSSGDSTGE